MKKMYFNYFIKYNGNFYDAGSIINVKDNDVESMKSQGGFLVEEAPSLDNNQKTTSRKKSAQNENNDGELKPKPKPTRGTKQND